MVPPNDRVEALVLVISSVGASMSLLDLEELSLLPIVKCLLVTKRL